MFYPQAHSDRISVLRVINNTIISGSYDRTVKMWDRNTKKQVHQSLYATQENYLNYFNLYFSLPILYSLLLQLGMFVCGGPVLVLEVNPEKPSELVCGDGQGKLYFLSWKE